MLLNVIFLYCISVGLAYQDVFDFFHDATIADGNETFFRRDARGTVIKDDFEPAKAPSCEQMGQTKSSPFVVLLLFRSSGRFLGMGSILDKTTVITAAKAVETAVQSPHDLFALAGRLGPWWGKDSQVKRSDEILMNDEANMALVKLKKPFRFNKFIAPIKVPTKKLEKEDFTKEYDIQYAVFGIPRSSFDIPGDPVPKTSTYIMKVETLVQKADHLQPCKHQYPDRDFSEDINICTIANGTYCWGCIGSPTIAVSKHGMLQIATITKAAFDEKDVYHVHTKLDSFLQWIRSQTFINYKND